ncbi:MAG: cobalamin-dependent protein [Phycisphaerales bacterium]|nr:cobalamin-dependent protein [Phycisphaerales bacterium]
MRRIRAYEARRVDRLAPIGHVDFARKAQSGRITPLILDNIRHTALGLLTRSREDAHTALSVQVALDRAATELYHQLNYLADISACAREIADRLAPLDSDDLARVSNELIALAHSVATGCRASLGACRRTHELLEDSLRSFASLRERFDRLIESSRGISKVAETIDLFARQSTILSLNARIEAARAGEHGAAFATVSHEVQVLSERIKTESVAIRTAVKEITNSVDAAGELVEAQAQRSHDQEGAVAEMIQRNKELLEQGARLPEMTALLDRCLARVEDARSSTEANQMIGIATGNLERNIRGIHRLLRRYAQAKHRVVGSEKGPVELFIDQFVDVLVSGRETPVQPLVQAMLNAGVAPLACLDAVGKAVQAANLRQKHQHVSVGDYYLNFLAVEAAMAYLRDRLPSGSPKGMKVVLGNARGDYHSLGREMVGSFLRANGIEVIDVGLGAEAEKFVSAVAESGAKVVGVSSLLIESAKEIAKIRAGLDRRGFRDTKIVAGGACFTVDRELYREVRADYVATAASDMVNLVQRIYEHDPLSNEVA